MIRLASTDDIPALLALARTTGQHFDAARLTQSIGHALSHGCILVSDRDGQIVSMAGIRLRTALATTVKYAEVMAWFTDPSHRTAVSGRQLLDAIEAWALTKAVSSVIIVTPMGSNARHLARRGYLAAEIVYQKALDAD